MNTAVWMVRQRKAKERKGRGGRSELRVGMSRVVVEGVSGKDQHGCSGEVGVIGNLAAHEEVGQPAQTMLRKV